MKVNGLCLLLGGGGDVGGGGGEAAGVGGEEVAVEVVLLPAVGKAEGDTAGAAADRRGVEAPPEGGVVEVEVDAVDGSDMAQMAVFVEVDSEDAVVGNLHGGGGDGRHGPSERARRG